MSKRRSTKIPRKKMAKKVLIKKQKEFVESLPEIEWIAGYDPILNRKRRALRQLRGKLKLELDLAKTRR